jgi:predicted nucleic acid-binding Zn ribbon protein
MTIFKHIPKTCIECGGAFLAALHRTVLCSPKCRTRHYWRLNPKPRIGCKICGLNSIGIRRGFCSDGCRDIARKRKLKFKDRKCLDCGKVITTRNYKFCAEHALKNYRKRRVYKKISKLVEVISYIAKDPRTPPELIDYIKEQMVLI